MARLSLVASLVLIKELPVEVGSSPFPSALPGLDGVGDDGGFKSGYCIIHSRCVSRLRHDRKELKQKPKMQ